MSKNRSSTNVFPSCPTINSPAVEQPSCIAAIHHPAQVLGTNAAVYQLVGHVVSVTPPLSSHISSGRPVSAVGHTHTKAMHIVGARYGPVFLL